jgi:hypothetical protein
VVRDLVHRSAHRFEGEIEIDGPRRAAVLRSVPPVRKR